LVWAVEDDAHFFFITIVLGISGKEVVRAGTKAEVIKKLIKRKAQKGLIDEDPGSSSPRDLETMRPVAGSDELEAAGIKVLGDPQAIIFRPRFEEWILSASIEANVNIKEYGFPERPSALHDQLKGIGRRGERAEKFKGLIKTLVSRSRRGRRLKGLLNEKDC